MKTMAPALVGLGFGFVMSRVGFTSWDAVHGMFTFTDFRLLLAFMTSVMILLLGWILIRALRASDARFAPRGMHPGILPGGALFGAGWALSGACPTIALAQLGEGQLAALYTVLGIVTGNWIYAILHERYFRWPTTSCADE